MEFVRKYIQYARNRVMPVLTEEAEDKVFTTPPVHQYL